MCDLLEELPTQCCVVLLGSIPPDFLGHKPLNLLPYDFVLVSRRQYHPLSRQRRSTCCLHMCFTDFSSSLGSNLPTEHHVLGERR